MSGIAPKGAVVVITGAGSGIGAATARRFARQGATVVASDVDEAAAARTAKECRDLGSAGYAYECDVADLDAVKGLAMSVTRDVGDTDILVNNAGVGVGGPFLDTTVDDWLWLRSINLDGVVHGCRVFGESMVGRGRGQVVNIASGAAFIPNRRMAAYCASKAAVVMFSRCLRADWAGQGVGVSTICPGVINTPILGHTRLRGSSQAERGRFAKAFALSHSPDLVAKAVVRAAQRNQGTVSVGVEAVVGYHAFRLLPPFADLAARV